MYVIVAYHPHRPPAVYGPVEDRHPPTTPEPPHSIVVRVPLHPATTRLGTPPADPTAPPGGWPRTVHTSRRLADAITTASPPPSNAMPVIILLASPTSGLLTAIGPFTTTTTATNWLEQAGRPGGDITAAAFLLHTPPARPDSPRSSR
jgi:hypothetical protein